MRYLCFFVVGLVAVAGGCWSMSAANRSAETPSIDTSTPVPARSSSPSSTANDASPTAEPTPSIDKMTSAFYKNLPAGFTPPADESGKLLLREYGSVFIARGGATPPTKVVFKDDADVKKFQDSLQTRSRTIGGSTVELQAAAMDALNKAIDDASKQGVSIGPRGADSAKRGYTQTVTLWASRVNPALAHWLAAGRITKEQAASIRSMSPYEQVPAVLKLEADGIWFAKDFSKSIIYSVAPPGTSQHLSMLALDVKQFDDPRVRSILAAHGWFQTVASDLPHFTYLGVEESELPGLGLKRTTSGGRTFWVPDI